VRVGTGLWNPTRFEMWVTIHVVVCRIVTYLLDVTVRGWSKGKQELEGLVILDRLTRKGPGAGRDKEREVCCYRDSSGLTQGWRDGSWISC
jgi:hypothetical protein